LILFVITISRLHLLPGSLVIYRTYIGGHAAASSQISAGRAVCATADVENVGSAIDSG
jgi:hypothetical protein